MRLHAKGSYRSSWGEWPAGKTDTVSDEVGGFLLRDSPGTFEVVEDTALAKEALSAMSTETETGLVVPDRRARGGRRR